MIRLMLVDDHAVLRNVLMELFEGTEDIAVVSECGNGCEVVEAALGSRPDVVLMDLNLPDTDGLEVTRRLLLALPDVRVVVFTDAFSVSTAREARRLGAMGYLLKGQDPFNLPQQIRDVAAGGTAWSAPVQAGLADVG
jgi:DNA-binding NarL/FixJ family response regulator